MCSVVDRYNYKLNMKSMHAVYKTNMQINSSFKETITINLWIFHFLKKTSWAVKNVPWSSSSQDNVKNHQCPFIIHIDLWKYNTYRFYIKNKKYIYCAHTGVEPGMSTMGDASCRHPNHSSRANIFQTASIEWNNCLPICGL